MSILLLFLITWVVLWGVFSGCGMLVLRACNLRCDSPERWLLAFWVGWAAVLAFLQVWHFVFAINDAARWLIGGAGVAGLIWNGRDLLQVMRQILRKHSVLIALMVLFSLWMANRSIQFPDNVWDTGLYHVQAVKWASSHSIVPGLGNLHSRFGFGTTFFLYPALLNTGFWLDRTYHIANGLLFWVLFIQASSSLYTIILQRRFELYHVFNALFVTVYIWLMVAETYLPTVLTIIPTISNDPPVFAIGVFTSAQVFFLVSRQDLQQRDAFFRVLIVVLLSALGIAIKFNHLLLGASLSLLAFAAYFMRFMDFSLRQFVRLFVLLGLVAGAVLIPMFARSVVLTGYPLYPMTWFAADVEWRISPEHAAQEWEFIRAFARDPQNPSAALSNGWQWLDTWLDANLRPRLTRSHLYFTVPLVWGALGTLALIVTRIMPLLRKRTGRIDPVLLWMLTATFATLTFWFFSAPAVRFAGASFWIIAVGASAILINAIPGLNKKWLVYGFAAGVMFLAVVPFLAPKSLKFWITGDSLYEITEGHRVELYTTESGLELWTPISNNKCWFAPLPCTPYPHPNLRLREEGDIGSGFILEVGEGDALQPIN